MKGKALRRALQTNDLVRIGGDIPLLTDETELITPARAYELLETNRKNRPINWRRVEEYAAIMKLGEWKVHGQGLMLDIKGNIITGQHRLWAVIYADIAVAMRISRGNPEDVAHVIDRGIPQSARDLATRETGRRHSPIEASLVRAILVAEGCLRPSAKEIAANIVGRQAVIRAALTATQGTKKTRTVLMILAAVCLVYKTGGTEQIIKKAAEVDTLCRKLEARLLPETADRCWGRAAAFGLAMQHAIHCIHENL